MSLSNLRLCFSIRIAPKLIAGLTLSSIVGGCAFVNRVSVTPTAGIEPNGQSRDPVASQDGRYIAFASDADNLVAGDNNNAKDIFVRDNQTGVTELISTSVFGGSANGVSGQPDISTSGRYVVYWSFGDDIVASDTNMESDVFLHDRQTGVTERVSVATGGAEALGGSLGGSVSNDGRHIAFYTTAVLSLGDLNNSHDVYQRDRSLGTTTLISTQMTGQAAGSSFDPVVSKNGLNTIFWSNASGMVGSNGFAHIYLKTPSVPVGLINFTAGGNGNSYTGDLGVGVYSTVAFVSSADNIVVGDTNGMADVFVGEWTGVDYQLTRITDGDAPSGAPALAVSDPIVGTTVAFTSGASNLQEPGAEPLDTNGLWDVYLWERTPLYPAARTRLMSQTISATLTNGHSFSRPAISANGAALAYGTLATNLGPTDNNGVQDIYIRSTHVPKISGVSGSLEVGQTSVLTVAGAFKPGVAADTAVLLGDGVASLTVDSVGFSSMTITVTLTAAATPGPRSLWVYHSAPELGIPSPLGTGDFEVVTVDP